MKKDLLICIAHHYSADRVKYLRRVIENFENNYKVSFDIKLHCSLSNKNLEHPFHLTGLHRQYMADNIENYEMFFYVEDDELLPFENYLNYIENFNLLWPQYVPSFVRIEEKDGEQYISDVPARQPLNIIEVGGKQFGYFPFPYSYNGFWIMPQKELKESINESFLKLSDGREFNAMWVGWGLNKTPLVEIENGKVSKKVYSYHLPNTYALMEGNMNGKIKVEEVFI